MSTSATSHLSYILEKVTICLGIPILISGVIGGLINIIVFRSIKSFRQSSCVFYLTVMSSFNIGQLLTGLLSRIMISGFNIDWTQSSVFYCKFRWYCLYVCTLTSLTCMCFATIDQFLATCSSPRWQRWSNVRVAHVVTAVSIFIWLIYSIPYLIYEKLVRMSPTGQLTCIAIDTLFKRYHSYISLCIFTGLLPIFVNAVFGLLAYLNVQRLSRRTLPLIRRALDRQLTVIVLAQTIYNFIAIVPFLIVKILVADIVIAKDPLVKAKLHFANVVTICLYYLNFAVSIKC
jgi:hypothetical protein